MRKLLYIRFTICVFAVSLRRRCCSGPMVTGHHSTYAQPPGPPDLGATMNSGLLFSWFMEIGPCHDGGVHVGDFIVQSGSHGGVWCGCNACSDSRWYFLAGGTFLNIPMKSRLCSHEQKASARGSACARATPNSIVTHLPATALRCTASCCFH